MRKIFSHFLKINISDNQGCFWKPQLWILVHLGIPILLGISLFFAEPLRINTYLLDMLPQSGRQKGIAQADKILGERNSREAIILAAAADFENAKKGAILLYDKFQNSPSFETLSLYFDPSVIAEFSEYLFKYRFVIAGKNTLDLLESGNTDEIALDALAAAYGAFNFIPLDNIDRDPFLLAGRRMEEFISSSFLSGGSLSLRDDVLTSCKDDTWYVLLRMTLTPQAVSLQKNKNAIREIYTAAAEVKETITELDFYFSGISFHSYESASEAQREIAIITTIMLSLVIALFLFVFRSPLPVIASIMDALISLALAAGTTLLIFREIHIITFVFGTTLIGTCVDYSIHFFIHWKGNPDLKSGYAIRSHISKSIIMCFVSTLICFSTFLFMPFPVLKQFAVFSIAGLVSAFLTAYCIYPLLKTPEGNKRQLTIFPKNISSVINNRIKNCSLPRFFRIVLLASLVLICFAVFYFSPHGLRVENDIRSFYTMSGTLMESEIKASQVLNYGSSVWYYIVSGGSQNEVLENEERLVLRLEEEISRGNIMSYLGTSIFAPSIQRQTKTYETMSMLLPMAAPQYENLGFPQEYNQIFFEEYKNGIRYCLPEDVPPQLGNSSLWIGEIGGQYYSCVIPINPRDEAIFRSIAEEFDFVYFINKAEDISHDLNTLTRIIIISFIIAYLVISIIICFVYHWRDSIKICAVPVFLCLSALTVLTLNEIPLGFFSIAAIILVFGLGLDFIIYMTGGTFRKTSTDKQDSSNKHGEDKTLTSIAVVLSFLTTFLSFGALAFSNFMPVHIFGLTVSGGIVAAFIATMLLQNRSR